MKNFILALVACFVFFDTGYSQSRPNPTCNHNAILVVIRAYEDSLALAKSGPVVREDYTLPGSSSTTPSNKGYKLYRCPALLDSLTVLIGEVMFARASPPVVVTDSISGVTETAAVFHAKVTSNGGQAVTAQWFRYGTSAASLVDSVAVAGTATPFTASLSTLTAGTTYYVAGFARNEKGTSSGDTLTFTTLSVPSVDTDAASDLAVTSATLNATFTDGGSEVTATGFKYGTDALLTSPTDVAGGGTTSPFTAALTGLTASTQYWAVGYATNALGTSYGDTITFMTWAVPAVFNSCGDQVGYFGHNYTTALIGSQCWFAENLRNYNYNDGTVIPGNLNNATWISTTSGAQTVYGEGGGNEAANLATYGRLYNWHAVNTGNLCPSGWHVPTDAEWTTLVTGLGASAGDKLKASNPNWDGTDFVGFSAVPGGYRSRLGNFSEKGNAGWWWTATSLTGTAARDRYLVTADSDVKTYSTENILFGFSVRCVQDPLTAPTVDTDAASSVTSSAATLNATITSTGGTAVTATGFKYGTDALLTSPTDVAGSGTTSPFTAALTGLTASTQYWAVGYATNAVGTSYGDTITFTSAPTYCSVPSVTYDGYTYTTVSIGTQCWFKENLRNENYSDGTPIPGWIDAATWLGRTSGAQAIAGEGGPTESSNLAAYGRLYNEYAVHNEAGLCPTGWHVPTQLEFGALNAPYGVAVAQLKSSPTDTPAWNGTNTTGFSALPGGAIQQHNGLTGFVGSYAFFWSSTKSGSGTATNFRTIGNDWSSSAMSGAAGYSVRCIQDPPTAPTVDTDAAGAVTETEATLNATFTDGGSAVTATGFKYGTDALLTSPTDVAGGGTTSPFTAALTGLTHSTQYWAVGYATNAVGTSFGDTITFTTSPFNCGNSTVTYDGHVYPTVQIGSKCWFKENLQNDDYNDGTPIPGNLDGTAWTGTSSGAQAVYGEGSSDVYNGSDDEGANLAIYGRLYNWYAVTTGKLCPSGWHVPLDSEWTSLVTVLGSAAGDQMKASIPDWDGINSSEFSALPGGTRAAFDGSFDSQGLKTLFWSSSPTSTAGWIRILSSGDSDVLRGNTNPRNGFSVRCVQDND